MHVSLGHPVTLKNDNEEYFTVDTEKNKGRFTKRRKNKGHSAHRWLHDPLYHSCYKKLPSVSESNKIDISLLEHLFQS